MREFLRKAKRSLKNLLRFMSGLKEQTYPVPKRWHEVRLRMVEEVDLRGLPLNPREWEAWAKSVSVGKSDAVLKFLKG